MANESKSSSGGKNGQPKKINHKAYYHKRRDELLSRRRDRYAKDPEYRARILKKSREAYRRARFKQTGGIEKPKKVYRRPRSRMVKVKGPKGERIVRLWTIAKVANSLVVTTETIRGWLQRGIIPAPSATDTNGGIWFSDDYIAFLVDVYKRFRENDRSLETFGGNVMAMWEQRKKEKNERGRRKNRQTI